MTRPTCTWAAANPDHSGWGTDCWGYSACRHGQCERKRQAAQRRKSAGAAFRKFPGSAYQQAVTNPPPGHCRWCGDGIRDPKNPSALALRRTWHGARLPGEPDCLTAYFLHTRMPYQLAHLQGRDGPLCASCGDAPGGQVDHRLALGLVVLVTPLIDRWTWWGPGNLQLLCHACHVAKTRADVAAIKLARRLLAGVAQRALL